ncbi:hypothetical protein [Aquimarina macrocephali]|uniref:hypothetical protein n=1 Tax=Aquimarina macrocephali TaxID=666563 RepID=UPI000462F27C|nr:hypothetical protein [Aquimarina macrocephali]
MKKELLKLAGAKQLAKETQKTILGGKPKPASDCGGRGDIECCGDGPGQCGSDPHCSGGMLSGGRCVCF